MEQQSTPIYDVEALDLLSEAIGGRHIPSWNDAPERTQAEVIEAFRKAEAIARGQA